MQKLTPLSNRVSFNSLWFEKSKDHHDVTLTLGANLVRNELNSFQPERQNSNKRDVTLITFI